LHQTVARRAMEIAVPVLASMGYELVDVEFKKRGTEWFLTFFIDKENGITLDDCESVSYALDSKLDADPAISGKHEHLVISSPGLDRPLRTDRDFERKVGSQLDIRLRESVEGRKAFTGTLLSFEDGVLRFSVGKKIYAIDRDNIALTRLHLNMNLEGGK
jgi:ribosome maturation factor RimP